LTCKVVHIEAPNGTRVSSSVMPGCPGGFELLERKLKHHFLDGIQSIQRVVNDLKSEVESLDGPAALSLVRSKTFSLFNLFELAAVQYRVMDKALDEAIRSLFEAFPNLCFITLAYCTEAYNDENEPGLNTLVFGFIPEELKEMPIRAIRGYLEGQPSDLSARERLFFDQGNFKFPVWAPVDFWQEDTEIKIKEMSPVFKTQAGDVHKIASQWFDAYEGNDFEPANEKLRYWRDGHFSRGGDCQGWA
jgi:hypothetical protein